MVVLIGVVAAVIAQLVTFATVMFNARTTRQRAERDRQWEIEDRKVLAAHVQSTSDTLAVKVRQTSEDLTAKVMETSAMLVQTVKRTSAALSEKVTDTSDALTAAIAENTLRTEEAKSAAHDAFVEANHVNEKIASLGLHRTTPIAGGRRTTDPLLLPKDQA